MGVYIMEFEIGNIVTRKSYGNDLFFKIVNLIEKSGTRIAILKGISYRIEADSPEEDLLPVNSDIFSNHLRSNEMMVDNVFKNLEKANTFKKNLRRGLIDGRIGRKSKLGKILHLDGDLEYMKKCLEQYKKLGLQAEGRFVPEKEQPGTVVKLLQDINPDILVLTGHDGLLKNEVDISNISRYRNSKYFIDATKVARRYESNMDSLVIFAGACQSMYGEIIKAGANFASSPQRVLIHALDPVLVSQQLATISFERTIEPEEVINKTITGEKGIGGVQTKGRKRDYYPAD
jgi:spore coat assembly protein